MILNLVKIYAYKKPYDYYYMLCDFSQIQKLQKNKKIKVEEVGAINV